MLHFIPHLFYLHSATLLNILQLIVPLFLFAAAAIILMLGARTKQINAYGKRNRRVIDASTERSRPIGTEIISIFDDLPPAPALASLASKMKKRENAPPSKHKALSPKFVGKQRPRRLSPVLSPPRKKTTRVAQIIDVARRVGDSGAPTFKPKPKPLPSGLQGDPIILSASPPRAPLSAFSLNVPGSPAVSKKPQARQKLGPTKVNPKLNKPFSPFVNMDIIVLDDYGQTVRKEHRVSRKKPGHDPKGQKYVTQTTVPSRLQTTPIPINIDPTNTESEASQAHRPKRSVKRAPLIILTDTESEEDNALQPSAPSQQMAESSAFTRPNNVVVEVVIPPAPYPIHVAKITHPSGPPLRNESASSSSSQPPPHPLIQPPVPRFQLPTPPLVKARQLTPIRGGHGKRLFEPPSPPSPSTPTNFELSLDFSDFNLDSPSQRNPFYSQILIPEHLQALLEECGQKQCGPHEFSAFIESFPYDPIIQSSDNTDTRFRKIGEASYSEVFGIGDVVLKVIPLRDESEANASQSRLNVTTKYSKEKPGEEVDGPAPSDAKDVRKEIIVTRAMGEVYGGFVKLLKTYVVRGRYPEVLLNLWDDYNERKGSESVRPGKLYCISLKK
jgi:serine/threonine-protein kinase haspin